MRRYGNLLDIPVEIIIHIISYLSVRDILTFGRTCHRFHGIITCNMLWWELCRRDYQLKLLPTIYTPRFIYQHLLHKYSPLFGVYRLMSLFTCTHLNIIPDPQNPTQIVFRSWELNPAFNISYKDLLVVILQPDGSVKTKCYEHSSGLETIWGNIFCYSQAEHDDHCYTFTYCADKDLLCYNPLSHDNKNFSLVSLSSISHNEFSYVVICKKVLNLLPDMSCAFQTGIFYSLPSVFARAAPTLFSITMTPRVL